MRPTPAPFLIPYFLAPFLVSYYMFLQVIISIFLRSPFLCSKSTQTFMPSGSSFMGLHSTETISNNEIKSCKTNSLYISGNTSSRGCYPLKQFLAISMASAFRSTTMSSCPLRPIRGTNGSNRSTMLDSSFVVVEPPSHMIPRSISK